MEMRKEIKIYLLAIMSIIITFMIIAISVNNKLYSLIPNDENLSDMIIMGNFTETDYDSIEEKNGIKNVSFQELLHSSTLVVKVEASDERELQYNTVLTKVKILDVYFGDKSLIDNNIYIYEPIVINPYKYNKFIMFYEGYVLMKPKKEYYLFLFKESQPQGYIYKGKRNDIYKLTKRNYGKYSCESCNIKCEYEQDFTKESLDYSYPEYSEMMRYDLVVFTSDLTSPYFDENNTVNHPVAQEYQALWKEVKSFTESNHTV
jgi:hypothetical protein